MLDNGQILVLRRYSLMIHPQVNPLFPPSVKKVDFRNLYLRLARLAPLRAVDFVFCGNAPLSLHHTFLRRTPTWATFTSPPTPPTPRKLSISGPPLHSWAQLLLGACSAAQCQVHAPPPHAHTSNTSALILAPTRWLGLILHQEHRSSENFHASHQDI